jgi:hypothetical protein
MEREFMSNISMQEVVSSNISAIGYDETNKELHVIFKSSGTYVYSGVEKNVFDAFSISESKGRFFNSTIKPGYKTYRKVIKIQEEKL